MSTKNEGCKLCNQKPVFEEYPSGLHPDRYNNFKSSYELVSGCYGELRAGADRDGRIVLWALGEGESDLYYPNYCPECGRKLKDGNA